MFVSDEGMNTVFWCMLLQDRVNLQLPAWRWLFGTELAVPSHIFQIGHRQRQHMYRTSAYTYPTLVPGDAKALAAHQHSLPLELAIAWPQSTSCYRLITATA
jgi:hypothetical protein